MFFANLCEKLFCLEYIMGQGELLFLTFFKAMFSVKKGNCGWQRPHLKKNTELLAVYYNILVYRNYNCLFFHKAPVRTRVTVNCLSTVTDDDVHYHAEDNKQQLLTADTLHWTLFSYIEKCLVTLNLSCLIAQVGECCHVPEIHGGGVSKNRRVRQN